MYNNMINIKNLALPIDCEYEDIFINNSKFINCIDYMKRISRLNTNILFSSFNFQLTDYMAKFIHFNSNRNTNLFKKLNCNAKSDYLTDIELFGCEQGTYKDFSEGKKGIFEIYDGGTVYLEEISKLPLFVQYKLIDLIEGGILGKSGSIRKITVDIKLIVQQEKI